MKKITVFTSTRAEYGLMRTLIQKLQKETNIKLNLIVTSTHLDPKFGNTINEIKSDEKYYIFYYDQNLKEENFFEISNKKDLLEFIHKLEFKNYEQRFIINQRLRYYFKNLYN